MATKIKEHGIAVALKHTGERLFIELVLIGKLTHEDYKAFAPIVNRAIKAAKGLEIDMLVDMRAFKGWKPKALIDDIKFGLKHRKAFNKIAVVGNKKWEEMAAKLFSPLIKGKIKFFKTREEALAWLLK